MGELKCEKLNKKYARGNIHAVKDVTACFTKGIHMIMGKSGCGKSSLLHMLGGLETPTSGKVIYDGADIYSEVDLGSLRKKNFGFIFQAYNLIPEISVKDNIMIPNYLAKTNNEEKFNNLVNILGLNRQLKQLPETLSGGEQQRVAIARALMNNPDIIFADEPTGNLDEENKEVVMQLLVDTSRQYGATLIMVTHESQHLKHADHIYYMKDGELTSTGNIE